MKLKPLWLLITEKAKRTSNFEYFRRAGDIFFNTRLKSVSPDLILTLLDFLGEKDDGAQKARERKAYIIWRVEILKETLV